MRLVLTLAIVLAACDGQPHGLVGSADAAPTPDAAASPDGGPPASIAFAVGTDFASGGIASVLYLGDLSVTQGVVAGVASTDPVVRLLDRIYVVNRFGADNVTVLDPRSLTLVAQVSTGAGTNPQDVAVAGDELYVAALKASGVLVIDRTRLATVGKTIDLSSLDPADGLPDCTSLAVVGDRLYVSCGILDDGDPFLTPRGPGKIAVIDTTTDELVTTLTLAYANPFGFMEATPADGVMAGDLLVATIPNFGDLTAGCLERITTGASPSVSCLVSNADLGGYAGATATDGDAVWVAVVTGFDPDDYGPRGSVRPFAPATGLGGAVTSSAERPFDLARCPSGDLVLADAAGGLRVYGPGGGERTTAPLALGLPPVAGGLVCFAP